MSIVVFVLKGIGIVLLVLLCVLLFLLLTGLFVPIRYKIRANYAKDGELSAKVNGHWLFHVVSVTVWWEEQLQKRIRICGILFVDSTRKTKIKKAKNTKNTIRSKEIVKSDVEQREKRKMKDSLLLSDREAESEWKLVSRSSDIEETDRFSAETAFIESDDVREVSRGRTRRTFFSKIKGKIKKQFIRWKRFICSLHTSFRRRKDRIKFLYTFFQRDDFQRAFALCKKQLAHLWNQIKPRKVSGRFHFGFEDPSITGMVWGMAGITYPIWNGGIEAVPEFDREVLEGSFYAKGRIRLFTVVKSGLTLFFDKDIRRLIYIWKKEEAKHAGSESV